MSIFLGGTGSANECHDYEEGTFNMSLSQGSNTSSNGIYVKIGSMVMCRGNVQCDNHTSGSTVVINGLPFTADGTAGATYEGNVRGYNWANLNGSTRCSNCVIHGNGTDVQFGTIANQGQGWEMLTYSDAGSTNNALRWTCVYKTND